MTHAEGSKVPLCLSSPTSVLNFRAVQVPGKKQAEPGSVFQTEPSRVPEGTERLGLKPSTWIFPSGPKETGRAWKVSERAVSNPGGLERNERSDWRSSRPLVSFQATRFSNLIIEEIVSSRRRCRRFSHCAFRAFDIGSHFVHYLEFEEVPQGIALILHKAAVSSLFWSESIEAPLVNRRTLMKLLRSVKRSCTEVTSPGTLCRRIFDA